ncbi:MAG: N,N-dimethylformamidase beta subunit family domain-containing protein [Gaiellaceae bacterium]
MRSRAGLPVVAVALLAVCASASAAPAAQAPLLTGLRVTNGSTPFRGDAALLTTVSPNGDGFRDAAHVRFTLSAPATIELDVVRTDSVSVDPEQPASRVVQRFAPRSFSKGSGELIWRPAATTPPRTYALELIVTGRNGATRVYAPGQPDGPRRAPIVRVQGIDAGFPLASYAPGQPADLTVATDASALSFQVFAYGGGEFPSVLDTRTSGQAMTAVAHVDWSAHRNAPAVIRVVRPGNWPSGLYFLRISADDGRVGYAPFVVRPKALGSHRVAVVLSTQTWQAYNFEDSDGDGWGDSWYVNGRNHAVDLRRPYLDFGIPYRFNDWDLTFLTWLQQTKHSVDYLSDRDLANVSGDALARLYDLIVFPGHEEYVTAHELSVIRRYRDLGGNLAFLAANNLFWHVDIAAGSMRRAGLWRDQGQPEASLVGAAYVGSNHGELQRPYVVTGATQAPWLFAGTGLENGSSFGRYGIEIDATGPDSPPGTIVLARIPDLLGPGKSAEMTYYETAAGAKVFDAGALDFAATATQQPVSTLLENLWTHLSTP